MKRKRQTESKRHERGRCDNVDWTDFTDHARIHTHNPFVLFNMFVIAAHSSSYGVISRVEL